MRIVRPDKHKQRKTPYKDDKAEYDKQNRQRFAEPHQKEPKRGERNKENVSGNKRDRKYERVSYKFKETHLISYPKCNHIHNHHRHDSDYNVRQNLCYYQQPPYPLSRREHERRHIYRQYRQCEYHEIEQKREQNREKVLLDTLPEIGSNHNAFRPYHVTHNVKSARNAYRKKQNTDKSDKEKFEVDRQGNLRFKPDCGGIDGIAR